MSAQVVLFKLNAISIRNRIIRRIACVSITEELSSAGFRTALDVPNIALLTNMGRSAFYKSPFPDLPFDGFIDMTTTPDIIISIAIH